MEPKYSIKQRSLLQRDRKPSFRQQRAVEAYLGGNGGKTKREALLEAGYSSKMANNPDRVFGSRAVILLMEEMGITSRTGVEILKRSANAVKPINITFPISRKGECSEEGMNDIQIREYLEDVGIFVLSIDCFKNRRIAHCYKYDTKTQLKVADMIFRLTGAYAPRKKENTPVNRVGIFSMKDLRERLVYKQG